jgi:hypothetical protein
MSDLVERLRTAARKACQRHNGVDQFDPNWQRKPKDFIEWDAADEIERLRKGWESLEWESKQEIEQLEGIIYRNCDPMAASDEDAKVIYSIAALEDKNEMSDLVREARRNAKNWADKPDSAAMWNRFADHIEQLEAALRRSCQCGEGMCSITGEQCAACAALEGGDGE